MKRQINKRGFTLIEVVLVLAIGGLIFLLAFLAFQQATKNRRDSQRRSDAGQVISEIENAKGDGGGSTFTDGGTLASFVESYLGGSGNATSSKFTRTNIEYTIKYSTDPTALDATVSSDKGSMIVAQKRKCKGNSFDTTVLGTGDYAVLTRLEKGVACRDNQ